MVAVFFLLCLFRIVLGTLVDLLVGILRHSHGDRGLFRAGTN